MYYTSPLEIASSQTGLGPAFWNEWIEERGGGQRKRDLGCVDSRSHVLPVQVGSSRGCYHKNVFFLISLHSLFRQPRVLHSQSPNSLLYRSSRPSSARSWPWPWPSAALTSLALLTFFWTGGAGDQDEDDGDEVVPVFLYEPEVRGRVKVSGKKCQLADCRKVGCQSKKGCLKRKGRVRVRGWVAYDFSGGGGTAVPD